MPITIPNQKNPEITIKILKDYYESLSNILKKYVVAQEYERDKINNTKK
jgi:hypothetical protein